MRNLFSATFYIMVALLSVNSSSAQADTLAEKGRAIGDAHKDAVVTIQLVVKQKFSFPGSPSRENESKVESTATVISPDGLAVASLSEIDPTSVIEAMMAGLPVVASRVGGVAELVEHGRTGILVPPGDPVALAKALESLLRDVKLRKCMGAAGRKRALKQFNLDSMLCSTHRVYEEVLSIKNQISDPAVPPTPI